MCTKLHIPRFNQCGCFLIKAEDCLIATYSIIIYNTIININYNHITYLKITWSANKLITVYICTQKIEVYYLFEAKYSVLCKTLGFLHIQAHHPVRQLFPGNYVKHM